MLYHRWGRTGKSSVSDRIFRAIRTSRGIPSTSALFQFHRLECALRMWSHDIGGHMQANSIDPKCTCAGCNSARIVRYCGAIPPRIPVSTRNHGCLLKNTPRYCVISSTADTPSLRISIRWPARPTTMPSRSAARCTMIIPIAKRLMTIKTNICLATRCSLVSHHGPDDRRHILQDRLAASGQRLV